MKILSKYIARLYLKFWLLSLSAMVLLVVVANLFGNVDKAFSSLAQFREFFDNVLSTLPITLDIALPLTVLLATLLVFNSLGRTSELVAMRAAGMGILRQMRPILLVLVFISGLDYYNQNYLYRILAKKGASKSTQNSHPRWSALGNRFYYVPNPGSERDSLSEVRVFEWADDPFRLQHIKHIAKITLEDKERILLENAVGRDAKGSDWRFSKRSQETRSSREFLLWFQKEAPEAHHMPILDLYAKIRQLESVGAPIEVYVLEWYQKTAAMFAPFVLVWFGMPLSQAFFRQGQASGEIIIGLLGGLLFLISTEILFTLGQGGYLPPLIATWATNAVYLILGSVLMLRLH